MIDYFGAHRFSSLGRSSIKFPWVHFQVWYMHHKRPGFLLLDKTKKSDYKKIKQEKRA